MKRYCHFHPISPAKWSCSTCRIDFDSACMPDANEKTQTANCPKCKKPLTFLDSRLSEQPFWEITPRFFLAPLHSEPLLLIVLVMLLSLAYFGHFAVATLAVILALVLVSNYGFQILKRCAEGADIKKRPGISAIFSGKTLKQSTGITVVLGLGFMSTWCTEYFAGMAPAILVAMLWLWLLPAILMRSIDDGDVRQAFRPDELIRILITMKQSYAGLVAYLLVVTVATLIIADFAYQHLPPICFPLLTAATASYFCLAMYSMIGYALSQQPALCSATLPGNRMSDAVASNTITDHIKRMDADIDIALKRGDYAAAVALLEGDLKRHSFSDLRRDQLFKLLSALKDYERLEHYAQLFLWLMVNRGQIIPAADFVRLLREHNPNFKLYDLDLSKVLAERFHKSGEYRLVIWTAKDAHTRFDPSPELAELYLRAAKTLLEKFSQKNKARSYLNYILKHLPDQPAAEAAKILDQHLHKKKITE